MLIGDDDDGGLAEELEIEAQAEQRLAALEAEPEDTISEPEDGGTAPSRESFVLLPFVTQLVSEHRTGGASAGSAVVSELKRAVRRAERALSSLDAVEEPKDLSSVESTIQKRALLLEQHAHKRPALPRVEPPVEKPRAQGAGGAQNPEL